MSESDNLILVDLFDRPVGSADKLTAHREGLLHRAFSVFIVSDGKMLIQRRNPAKYHSGGLWANACCSHPRVGEDLPTAVTRRLQEELGIQCPVEPVGSIVYRTCFDNDITEFEYDHLFLGTYAGPLSPDPEEIAETAWVSLEDLAESLRAEPERYTSWFLIGAHQVFEYLNIK